MPQARLPDINTSFITYRREIITSWKSQNYAACFGSLYALNGLLPEDYRVKISSLEYNELVNKDISAKCAKCDSVTNFKDLKIVNLLLPSILEFATQTTHDKFWECPKCHDFNRLVKTELVQDILAEPYFLKVVPKPPERRAGLLDRNTYHRKIGQWIWTFLSELEERMAQFRDDNWQKSEDLEGTENMEDAGEAEDV